MEIKTGEFSLLVWEVCQEKETGSVYLDTLQKNMTLWLQSESPIVAWLLIVDPLTKGHHSPHPTLDGT